MSLLRPSLWTRVHIKIGNKCINHPSIAIWQKCIDSSHVLYNYEPTLRNEESLCKELFFLPSFLHYYDNTFISAVPVSAVFRTEKLVQHQDNRSTVEPRMQSLHPK